MGAGAALSYAAGRLGSALAFVGASALAFVGALELAFVGALVSAFVGTGAAGTARWRH